MVGYIMGDLFELLVGLVFVVFGGEYCKDS